MSEVKEEEEYAEAFLSSGVDSSYIFAISDIENANSCGYDNEKFDESRLAVKTANAIGKKCTRCF